MTNPTTPELERLRGAYHAQTSVPATDVDQFLARVERGHRMRRRRLALASAAAVAVVAVAGGAVTRIGPGGSDTGPSTPLSGESAGADSEDPAAVNSITVDALYRRLDAVPGLGYYIVDTRTKPGAILVWTDTEQVSRVTAAASEVATERGVSISVRPRGELTTDGPLSEEDLSQTASEIKTMYDAHPEAGYAAAKIEVPFGRIVLWRTDATDVDDEARRTAAAAGAVLEIRGADYRLAELQAFIDALSDDNDRWQREGFTVTGAALKPSGAVVSVEGDVLAARTALRQDERVLAVVHDAVIDTPAKLPDRGAEF